MLEPLGQSSIASCVRNLKSTEIIYRIMMENLYSPPDNIKNEHGNIPLAVCMRVFPSTFHPGRKIYLESGWSHPRGWGADLNKKEKES